MWRVISFLALMMVGVASFGAKAKKSDDLIPMQKITYESSEVGVVSKAQVSFSHAIPEMLKVSSYKITESNVSVAALAKAIRDLKKSMCSVIKPGAIRVWLEASGKGGVIISATVGGGIEVTINCK